MSSTPQTIPSGPAANRVLLAAALVLLAMATLGYIDNLVRLIAREAGLWQFHLTRSAIALPMLALLAHVIGGRLRPLSPGRVAARSFFSAGSMMIYFGCLAFLPIGQVVAGLFTAPIFVLLISAFVYGERVGPWRIGAVALGFAGILFLLRPDAAAFSPMSVMPVVAGLFYAIGNIATRRWCAGESALTLLAGFFLGMGGFGALGLLLFTLAPQGAEPGAESFLVLGYVAPSPAFLFWTVVQAVGSIIGVGLIIRGYQLADASYVAVFEYALLIFAALWAFVLWGEVLAPAALLGMAAIALAGATIALRSR